MGGGGAGVGIADDDGCEGSIIMGFGDCVEDVVVVTAAVVSAIPGFLFWVIFNGFCVKLKLLIEGEIGIPFSIKKTKEKEKKCTKRMNLERTRKQRKEKELIG